MPLDPGSILKSTDQSHIVNPNHDQDKAQSSDGSDSDLRDGRFRYGLAICTLALVCFVTLFYNLGEFRTFGSHEVFASVPAREMLDSGDWLVPRYGGKVRLRKPPLLYWTSATSSQIFGEVTEFSTRFPSALSAIALVSIMGIWASRWYGPRAGFIAAFVQATSLSTISYGRSAAIDMPMCAFATLAMFLVAESRKDESGWPLFLRTISIHSLLSVLWISKFHFGPAMVLGPCAIFLLINRRFKNFWYLTHPLGFILQIAPLGIWSYFLLQEIPDAINIWQHETVGRAIGEVDNRPIYFYLFAVAEMTLPWGILSLFSIRSHLRSAWSGGDTREQFLSIWFSTHLVILSLSASKHPNYILLAMPVVTLLISQTAVRWWNALCSRQNILKPFQAAAIIGTCCLVLAAVWQLSTIESIVYLKSFIRFLAFVMAIGISCVIGLLLINRKRDAAALSLIVFLFSFFYINNSISPRTDHRLANVEFAKKIRAYLNEHPVYVYRMLTAHSKLDPVVFYLNEPVKRIESIKKLNQQLDEQKTIHVIAYEETINELALLGKVEPVMSLEPIAGHARPRQQPTNLYELSISSISRLGSDRNQLPQDYLIEEQSPDRVANESQDRSKHQ